MLGCSAACVSCTARCCVTVPMRTNPPGKDRVHGGECGAVADAESGRNRLPQRCQLGATSAVPSPSAEGVYPFLRRQSPLPGFQKQTPPPVSGVHAISLPVSRWTTAPGQEPLAIRWSRPLPSEPSTITVSKDSAGRYFISYLCEFDPESLPITPRMVGIDPGFKGEEAIRSAQTAALQLMRRTDDDAA